MPPRMATTLDRLRHDLADRLSPDAIRALNGTFPWADAYLAYDQGTILSRFAPKPPAWANKQGGRGMQA